MTRGIGRGRLGFDKAAAGKFAADMQAEPPVNDGPVLKKFDLKRNRIEGELHER